MMNYKIFQVSAVVSLLCGRLHGVGRTGVHSASALLGTVKYCGKIGMLETVSLSVMSPGCIKCQIINDENS